MEMSKKGLLLISLVSLASGFAIMLSVPVELAKTGWPFLMLGGITFGMGIGTEN